MDSKSQTSIATSAGLGLAYLIVASLFIYVVGYDLLVRGPFAWHLTRPSAVQGGVEAIILASIVTFAYVHARLWVTCFAAVAVLLYLRRHNAEFTILVALIYLELLLSIGHLLLGQGSKSTQLGEVPNLLVGAALCVLITAALSLFGLAYPATLLVLFTLLGIFSLVLRRRGLALVRLLRPLRPETKMEACLLGVTASWFIVLAARTANVIGHDSVWYLGRGDIVYAPVGSIFECLQFVSPVHYFPKLWETLVLPITTFDQLRLQEGFAIAVMLVSLVFVWQLCEKLSITRVWRFSAVLLLATLPAWANTALQMKSDVICTAMLLSMVLCLANWFAERQLSYLLYASAAAALAVSSKYTAIPFVGVTFLFVVLEALIFRGYLTQRMGASAIRPAALAFSVCLLAALVLLVRTWYLSGAPTVGPDPLLAIWRLLGFSLDEPVGTLNWTRPQVWSDVPRLFYEWFFAPSHMPKIRITWQGNYWLLFLLFGCLLVLLNGGSPLQHQRTQLRNLIFVLCLVGLLVAILWRYHSRGGDGNYYMFPLALVTCLAVKLIGRGLALRSGLAFVVLLSVFAFGAFQGTQSFIAAAWSKPGTRVLDMDFSRSPEEDGFWRQRLLKRMGIAGIAAELRGLPPQTRVVALGFEKDAVLLPVPTEDLMAIVYSRPEYVKSAPAVVEYLQRYNIQYLLLANNPEDVRARAKLLEELRTEVEARGWKKQVDKKGTIYSVGE
ncbi:glycosyltransferase family 39 protein [Gilvimarinus sp. DA14]|uniref:glycosyltransferase family 39 protein n=1 Tax=Gilvimarinus sp. DA14 TaxID=2956798 RepID=UPI0020B70BA5|nr:glycosyltransferase family 39 protein [Gilvimarinus sp. DA14]UTF59704.1 glycosyltransferase family 39 protein [Gilvimarinus sp. DA14]